jgi:hypothetical protein
MNFNDLSWASILFYYRSIGDKRYGRIMSDKSFISLLREAPSDISPKELEEKVILDYVNIINYDLLVQNDLASKILAKIVELQPKISSLQNTTILDCDFSNNGVTETVATIYAGFYHIQGLWLTGACKIVHLLNDKLFPILNPDTAKYFQVPEDKPVHVDWLVMMQQHAKEVTRDFQEQGYSGSPESFLSEKVGYIASGYKKSLAKFLDEYFWLRFGDNLPIPPAWLPLHQAGQEQTF